MHSNSPVSESGSDGAQLPERPGRGPGRLSTFPGASSWALSMFSVRSWYVTTLSRESFTT
jgi:hypothetical protein